MLRIAIVISCLTAAAVAWGQGQAAAASAADGGAGEVSKPFWPAMTAQEMVVAPSPEVASLGAYTDASVDMSTGTGSLAFGLASLSVGNTKLDVGLSYRISGFTTDEEPGWIGLGWNLTGMGCVTRMIAGQPDEKKPFDLRSRDEIESSADSLSYLTDLIDLEREATFDRYSYLLPSGESGQFYIAGSEVIEMPRSNNRIELIGQKADGVYDFRITAVDGTVYEFTEREHTNYTDCPEGIDEFYRSPNYYAVSAWHISRLITPERADTIVYEYKSNAEYARDRSCEIQSFTITWGNMTFGCQRHPGVQYRMANQASILIEDMRVISAIRSRNGTISFQQELTDGPGAKMYLKGMKLINCEGTEIKDVAFRQTTLSDSRRVLAELTVTSGDQLIEKHEFAYNDRRAHSVGDFFNYPNYSRTGPYYPTTVIDLETGDPSPRRMPDPAFIDHGTLRSSVNTLGVQTTYEYEPNTIVPEYWQQLPWTPYSTLLPGESAQTVDTLVTQLPKPDPEPFWPVDTVPDADEPYKITIGVRLKSITALDPILSQKRIRKFTYDEGMTTIDFRDVERDDFYSLSGLRWLRVIFEMWIETMLTTTCTLQQSSRGPGFAPEAARIYYGKVTESVSGTGLDQEIRTDYEFDLSQCRLDYVECSKVRPAIDPYGGITSLDTCIWQYRVLQTPGIPNGYRPHESKCFIFTPRQGYFRERIGARPQLKRQTTYRFVDGEYLPKSTDELYYSIVQKRRFINSTFQELMVRRYRNFTTGVIHRDIKRLSDFNYFTTDVEAIEWQLDSVSHREYFADGSDRLRKERFRYSHTYDDFIKGDSIGHGHVDPGQLINPSPDQPVYITPGDTAFNTDSLTSNIEPRLLISTVTDIAGQRLEHHTAFSAMCRNGFYCSAASRGLKTLPVAEMWVMNCADTLLRRYDYNLFSRRGGHSLTRISAISTSINGHESDRLSVDAYSAYGKPISVSQTGKATVRYAWGYGGDLLTGVSLVDSETAADAEPYMSLTTSYEHIPLIGCTKITSPSGKAIDYGYSGLRLSRISLAGQILTGYDYSVRAESGGLYGGRNSITTRSYVTAAGEPSVQTRVFDGFGRAVAEVSEGAGGDGGDVAALTRYDALGRKTAAWVPLPLSADALDDALRRDTPLQQAALAEFSDAAAMSVMTYPAGEATDMALTATIAGTDFAAHPSRSELTCSNPADLRRRVVRWRWDGSSLQANGFYGAGELSAVRSEDGDGRVSYLFTDCLGRTVLQRSLADDDVMADTYTVSDAWGNPLLVIPPEASAELGSSGQLALTASEISSVIDRWCYVYRYDSRLRLRSKKLPGCEPVAFAYDADSRLAFTRDGNQAQLGQRSFVIYDPLGRTAVTGICDDALSESFWTDDEQPDVPAMRAVMARSKPLDATFCGSGYHVDAATLELLAGAELLTSTFYDGYSFLPPERGAQLLALANPTGTIASPAGLVTGSLTAVLGPAGIADTIAPLLSVTFYDAEERPAVTIADTHRGGLLRTATEYNLAGLPTAVRSSVFDAAGVETTLECTTAYDSFGRPTQAMAAFDGKQFNLGRTAYDRLGRAAAVSSEGDIVRTSSYDLHGWLTGWESPALAQQLLYGSGPRANYSGRVSSKLTAIGDDIRRYDYTYDRLGRLTAADFSSETTPAADFSTTYEYDLQGNILSLVRMGLVAPGLYDEIDRITAQYNGNHLSHMMDTAGDVLLETSLDMPQGRWTGGFFYDDNGNQVSDPTRGIFAIYYNPLNLPQGITLESGVRFNYLYSAAGTKLSEMIYDIDGEEPLLTRDYAGIFEYENSGLARISLASGFITPSTELDGPKDPPGFDPIITPITPITSVSDPAQNVRTHPGVSAETATTATSTTTSAETTTTATTDSSGSTDPTGTQLPQLPGFPGFPTIDRSATYHLYAFDYQGNIVGVYNTKYGTLEQTADYYPYGLPHADPNFIRGNNRRLYSAKELTTEAALNTYDFAARTLPATFPIFSQPDPLAERYTHLSPHSFCAGDPINNADPSGREIVFHETCSATFIRKYNEAKEYLKGTDAGRLIESIEKNTSFKVTLIDGSYSSTTRVYYDQELLYWDPTLGILTTTGYFISPAELLGHEADHINQYYENKEETVKNSQTVDNEYGNKEDKRVIEGSETTTAHQLGRLPQDQDTRYDHGGTTYKVPEVNSTEEDIETPISMAGEISK